MKLFTLILIAVFYSLAGSAQHILVNGDVTTKKDLPIQGVIVMAFDNGRMIKNYITDEKGEYRFYVEEMAFDLLYYKPGMRAHTCSVNNHMEKDNQGFNISIQLDDSTARTATNLASWLKQHHVTATYLDSVYTEELKKANTPKPVHKSKKQLQKEAVAEQKRFSNYKESTVKDSTDSQVTTLTIGPDTYECITAEKGTKRYLKNDKPISEATYRFETSRRYDGVLKGTRSVKKLDKYKPMEHVKGEHG